MRLKQPFFFFMKPGAFLLSFLLYLLYASLMGFPFNELLHNIVRQLVSAKDLK